MTKILIALALLLAVNSAHARAIEGDRDFYGTTIESFDAAPDRYAHPRSVEEYRRIVSEDDDAFGMCRNAEHLDQCLRAWYAWVEKVVPRHYKIPSVLTCHPIGEHEVSCHETAIDVFPMGRPRALLPPEGIPPAPHFVFAESQQIRVYDAHGRSIGTATTDSQGTTTFRDSRGSTTGTASTSAGRGTTVFRDSRGRTIGRSSK